MGTIKTTVKLETNALPFPINYTTSATTVVKASNYSRISISDAETATLSNIKFGTEGGFLYAQSLSTNTSGTTINIWLVSVEGDREIASLSPGEAIILPLSSSQQGIYATTNLGKTAILDYHVSDKGGKWGQSTIVLFDNNTNWEYVVIDVNVNQTPIRVDTGFTTADWSLWDTWVIQDKSYILEFNNDDVCYVFIDSRGNKVSNTIPSNVGTGGNILGGKTFAKIYGTTITVFDGDNVSTHNFDGADSIYIEDNYDNTTADGSFIVYANLYDGASSASNTDSTFLINGSNKYFLTSLNYGSGPTQYQYTNTYVYQFANFVAVRIYNDDSGFDVTYKIFDTSGILLQSLDVSAHNLINEDFVFYGDNTVQLISHSNLDGRYYMFNYNHELDRLIGKNFEWSVPDTYEYYISHYSKSIGFVEPYEPNGIAITFYTNDNFAGWAYLSQYTENCQIHYLVEGMSSFSVYTPNKPIWFQRDFYVTKTTAFFVWGNNDGNATGPIKMLALNSSLYNVQDIDANSVILLDDLQPVHSSVWSINRYPAGNEYIVHTFSQQVSNDNYMVIAKKGLVRSLTMTDAEWNWYSGYNSLVIALSSSNYNQTNFYYDFKQNTFVNINKIYYVIDIFPNYGTYGVGDVKKYGSKLFMWQPPDGLITSARVLDGNNLTPDVILPYSGNNLNWYLGYDFIVWLDFNTTSQTWIVYVYDMALTLISTYDTGCLYLNSNDEAGSRIFLRFNDGTNSHYIWVSKKGVVKIPDTDYHVYIFNDYRWWN